jgi:hypothetical protein
MLKFSSVFPRLVNSWRAIAKAIADRFIVSVSPAADAGRYFIPAA